MKKKTTLSEEDQALFRQLMAGTRKIKQDTIVHRPQRKKISEVPVKRLIQEQADASHYFSDEFQPLLIRMPKPLIPVLSTVSPLMVVVVA